MQRVNTNRGASMMREGSQVSFTGSVRAGGPALGDQGRVLASAGDVAHVVWSTGALLGQATALYQTDLVVAGQRAQGDLDDSLDVGGLVSFSVRQTFDQLGEVGVINALASTGHLGAFGEIAEEALAMVAQRIRHDASLRAVTAELDEDEAELVLRLAASCLIRDAFGSDD